MVNIVVEHYDIIWLKTFQLIMFSIKWYWGTHWMRSSILDASLLFKTIGNQLSVLCATYVDDSVHAWDRSHELRYKESEKRFQCKPREWDSLQFAEIKRGKNGDVFSMHQKRYIKRIQGIGLDADFTMFRSLLAKLAWSLFSRPDINFAVAALRQIIERMYLANSTAYMKDALIVLC